MHIFPNTHKHTHTLIAGAEAQLEHKLLHGSAFKHPDTLVTVQSLKRLLAAQSSGFNTT